MLALCHAPSLATARWSRPWQHEASSAPSAHGTTPRPHGRTSSASACGTGLSLLPSPGRCQARAPPSPPRCKRWACRRTTRSLSTTPQSTAPRRVPQECARRRQTRWRASSRSRGAAPTPTARGSASTTACRQGGRRRLRRPSCHCPLAVPLARAAARHSGASCASAAWWRVWCRWPRRAMRTSTGSSSCFAAPTSSTTRAGGAAGGLSCSSATRASSAAAAARARAVGSSRRRRGRSSCKTSTANTG